MTAARNCIKCGQPQEPFSIAHVEIDRCPGCGGMWLDRGEIDQLANLEDDSAFERLDVLREKMLGLSPHPDSAEAAQKILNTPCPACSGKLTIAEFGSLILERCHDCDGIYLDRDELTGAMEVADTSTATTIVAIARSVHTSGTIG